MSPKTKQSKTNQKIVIIDLDKSLDDIIRQEIHILQHVKALCPKDFTEQQIAIIFDKAEALYNSFIVKLFKDQTNNRLNEQRKENNKDDTGYA